MAFPRCAHVAIAMVLCSACHSPPGAPYDPSKSLERRKGALYQGDLRVNPTEVAIGLEREPEAGRHIRRARTYYQLSLAVATASGAFLGIPLGQAVVHSSHPSVQPNGALAAVGAGLFALDIVLLVAVAAAQNRAISAHNRNVSPLRVPLGETSLELRPQALTLTF